MKKFFNSILLTGGVLAMTSMGVSATERQVAINMLQDLVQINSENDNEAEVARYLQKLLKQHGIEAKLIPYKDGRANLVAEIKNGSGKTLVISGHMDVVSAGDESAWKYPPFSGHIDEQNVMWGRGTSDMKSGLAALVWALIDLNNSKNFKGTIRLLATVGEEIGQYGSQQLTDLEYVKDADGLLIAEPANVGIIYAHKGSLNYKISSKGVAAHSSMPEQGSNAIENLVVAMEAISSKIVEKAATAENKVLGKSFNNITLMKGGIQINSIPDYAEFEANARTVPEFDNQALIAEVQKVVSDLNVQKGFQLSVEVTADLAPVQANPDSALIKAIIEENKNIPGLQVKALFDSMGDVLGVDLSEKAKQFGIGPLRPIVASGTTDAAQFTRANKNMDLAVYGPGVPMLNHKVNERIPLSQYLDFIEAYKGIISRYLQ